MSPPIAQEPPAAAGRKRRILIVDDHAIMREGLSGMIGREPDLEVCGATGDAFAALDLAVRLKPDLMLVDIDIAGKSGLELIKYLHVQLPQITVLTLSMHDETVYAERVLRAGGRGYVMKREGGERLLAAIRQVPAGNIAVSPSVAAKVLSVFSGVPSDISPIARLTDRELEVFQHIGRGEDTATIARNLHVSAKTVDVHRQHIKGKLGIVTTTELISFAARWVG